MSSNFEKLFAKKFNLNQYCIAVANGTVTALEAVALRCLNLKSMMKFLFLANHINPQQVLLSVEENSVFCDIILIAKILKLMI